MFFDAESVADVAHLLFFLLAYCLTVPVVSMFHAWVTSRFGDDTAVHMGRLSLDPLRHLSVIGALLILLPPHVGLGRYMPINPVAIQGPMRRLKLICAYLAGSAGFFLLAVASVCILAFAFGGKALGVATYMIHSGQISFLVVAGYFPGSPAWFCVSLFSLILFMHCGIFSGVLYFFFDGALLLSHLFFGDMSLRNGRDMSTIFLVSLFANFIFAHWVRGVMLFVMLRIGQLAATLAGGA